MTLTNNISVVPNTTQENLKELVAKYQPQLKSFIRGKVSNNDDAEDILQDVFYQLVKTVNSAMNPIENISAWLYRVAHNTIINSLTKKKEVELPYYQDDESDNSVLKDFSEILFNDTSASTPEMEYLSSLCCKWSTLYRQILPIHHQRSLSTSSRFHLKQRS